MDVYATVEYPGGEIGHLHVRMGGPGSVVDAIIERGAAAQEWTLIDVEVEF